MVKMTDWMDDGCVGNGQERGRIEGKEERKGRENKGKMGGIRGEMLVRTNAEKSSKKWFFIQNLPPLQIGKCCQSAPDNCDYMVNPTLPPAFLSEYRDIKQSPKILYEYRKLIQADKKSCFRNFSRAYIMFFFFFGKTSALFPYLHLSI